MPAQPEPIAVRTFNMNRANIDMLSRSALVAVVPIAMNINPITNKKPGRFRAWKTLEKKSGAVWETIKPKATSITIVGMIQFGISHLIEMIFSGGRLTGHSLANSGFQSKATFLVKWEIQFKN